MLGRCSPAAVLVADLLRDSGKPAAVFWYVCSGMYDRRLPWPSSGWSFRRIDPHIFRAFSCSQIADCSCFQCVGPTRYRRPFVWRFPLDLRSLQKFNRNYNIVLCDKYAFWRISIIRQLFSALLYTRFCALWQRKNAATRQSIRKKLSSNITLKCLHGAVIIEQIETMK